MSANGCLTGQTRLVRFSLDGRGDLGTDLDRAGHGQHVLGPHHGYVGQPGQEAAERDEQHGQGQRAAAEAALPDRSGRGDRLRDRRGVGSSHAAGHWVTTWSSWISALLLDTLVGFSTPACPPPAQLTVQYVVAVMW